MAAFCRQVFSEYKRGTPGKSSPIERGGAEVNVNSDAAFQTASEKPDAWLKKHAAGDHGAGQDIARFGPGQVHPVEHKEARLCRARERDDGRLHQSESDGRVLPSEAFNPRTAAGRQPGIGPAQHD
jgi:hypothetical protein